MNIFVSGNYLTYYYNWSSYIITERSPLTNVLDCGHDKICRELPQHAF